MAIGYFKFQDHFTGFTYNILGIKFIYINSIFNPISVRIRYAEFPNMGANNIVHKIEFYLTTFDSLNHSQLFV